MSRVTKRRAYCTFQIAGLHQCKGTSSYLRHPHRHLFHFRVEASSFGIEFIGLRTELINYIRDRLLPDIVVQLSCEQIAGLVIDWLVRIYGEGRSFIVEVSEDGENGAIVSSYVEEK